MSETLQNVRALTYVQAVNEAVDAKTIRPSGR